MQIDVVALLAVEPVVLECLFEDQAVPLAVLPLCRLQTLAVPEQMPPDRLWLVYLQAAAISFALFLTVKCLLCSRQDRQP